MTVVNPKIAVGKIIPARNGSQIKTDDSVITSFTGAPPVRGPGD